MSLRLSFNRILTPLPKTNTADPAQRVGARYVLPLQTTLTLDYVFGSPVCGRPLPVSTYSFRLTMYHAQLYVVNGSDPSAEAKSRWPNSTFVPCSPGVKSHVIRVPGQSGTPDSAFHSTCSGCNSAT